MAEILETAMIICFGVSWPVNLFKAVRSRTTKGSSLLFLCLIEAGYIVGIIGKFINADYIWRRFRPSGMCCFSIC